MIAWSKGKIAFACALLLPVASAIWFGVGGKSGVMPRGSSVVHGMPYAPANLTTPEPKTVVWEPPPALRRDRTWTYEVFTPPEIFYNESTRQFMVSSPVIEAPANCRQEPAFDLELAAIRPLPFRLQLVGYLRGEGGYVGIFANVGTGETYLARAGRSIPELGLVITEFKVTRLALAIPESMTSNELVATALVRDAASGEVTVLTDQTRVPTGNLHAVLRHAGDKHSQREAGEGDVIAWGAARYKIGKIRLAPPSVVVYKLAQDGSIIESKILVPSAPSSPQCAFPVIQP